MFTWSIYENLPVRLGYLHLTHCQNSTPLDELTQVFTQAITSTQARWQNQTLTDDPVIQQVRLLFRAVGLDPTRYRPSSEALIRRALKNEPVRSINPLVDINNLCSMQAALPMGCYDATKIQGNLITIRLGQPEEEYEGVAKQISIAGKLCLADAQGPFGSPISDSARTQVTPQTTDCLVVIFSHQQTDTAILEQTLQQFSALAQEYLQATVVAQGII